jgi:hypothetical protein
LIGSNDGALLGEMLRPPASAVFRARINEINSVERYPMVAEHRQRQRFEVD